MTTEEIRKLLVDQKDEPYSQMQYKVIPTLAPGSVIGVRTPQLRKMAKELSKKEDVCGFLTDLPHKYFDENQLHAFILSEEKDFEKCIDLLEKFLPFVDNWATCDQMSPKAFKKHRKELLPHIDVWLSSEKTYTIRYGIGMLMEHFLDEDFDPSYPAKVSKIRSDEYYVNMMIAWYFATALAKQYDVITPYIVKKKLDPWTHNKTIQKAIESYRITDEQKAYLRTLKIKKDS